jgi:NosR/NirI family transcriptional regulator, nitrous oxide reductase regulator
VYVPLVTPYLHWLQKGNPTGEPEAYPEIGPHYESTLPGVYIVGDLTGVPLLKMAAEGGAKVIRRLLADPDFQARRQGRDAPEDAPGSGVFDVLILGGGPAGVACALECERAGLAYLLLESTQLFSTLENFPQGKLILAKPDDYPGDSPLSIRDGHKESLLEDLRRQIQGKTLQVRAGTRAKAIRLRKGWLEVESDKGSFQALRVVVAIGKTGDARRLKVPGEDLPHVFNRLFDPGEFHGEDILVVGGGDSAVEAAVALAETGNRVTLAYRKERLDRPKPENQARFEALCREGRITALYRAEVREIGPAAVRLATPEGDRAVPARRVFVLIGRELPLAFFRRSGIRMAGQRDRAWYVFLVAMLSFFSMLYFGKAGLARDLFQGMDGVAGRAWAYLSGPFSLHLNWAAADYAWYASLNFYLGWLGSLIFLITGSWALGIMLARRRKYFGSPWARVKYGYLIAVGPIPGCMSISCSGATPAGSRGPPISTASSTPPPSSSSASAAPWRGKPAISATRCSPWP